ncbi:MAG TPA: type II toxin-antitoxin system death-on-curing family toxin [Candidatus Brocadiia bacterium]|nr:type II toxin-antitoxin system death-on-curing family toxin [Candidatus Brocadiia bacterium]
MEPDFLSLGDVLEIHRDQIGRYGGGAGVRDMGLLQSALAVPRSSFGGRYLHGDLFEMAAAYLFHIVNNHPFIDGNKRAGAVAAIVFLSLNGIELEIEEDDLASLVLSVARGEAGKDVVAEFLRQSVKR